MSKQSINVILNPDGTVQVEAIGYKGNSCEQATKFIEEALGLNVSKRTKKPEWYQSEATKNSQRIGQ